MSMDRGDEGGDGSRTEGLRRNDVGSGHTILVVAKRTGIAMETLRAWERRYGFPKPARKEGSNRRLYSDEDIHRLGLLKRAIDAGYRIGDVVNKSLPDLTALSGDVRIEPEPPRREVPREAVSVEPMIVALQRDDLPAVDDGLRHAASVLGPKRFVTEVAHPFMVRVGEIWAAGKIGVRHEHAASEAVITRLRSLLASYQDIEGHPVVLLATLPGEPHGLALQMVGLYLAVKSARPRLVGANTPPEELAEAARRFGADVVGVTVTETVDKKEARRSLKTLRRALPPRIPIWLGGGGARAVDPNEESAKIVMTWDDIDRAVAAERG